MQFCHNFLYRCVSDTVGPHSPPKRQYENTRDTCCVVCGLPLICQRCVVVLSAGGVGGFVRRRSLPAMPEGTVCHGLSFHRERASARTVIWHKWKSKVWLLHRCPLPGFHHDIPRSFWSIPGACYCELEPKCQPSLSHISIFEGSRRGGKNAAFIRPRRRPSTFWLFLLLLAILQLSSQLGSWFRGTVCALAPHLLSSWWRAVCQNGAWREGSQGQIEIGTISSWIIMRSAVHLLEQ